MLLHKNKCFFKYSTVDYKFIINGLKIVLEIVKKYVMTLVYSMDFE